MNIEDMEIEFNRSQIAVIVSLQEQVAKLQEENKSLQTMLEGTVQVFHSPLDIGISNQRIVCETQLAILKNAAITRELTLEEARKLQIYVDVLDKLQETKDDGINADIIPEAELLKMVGHESTK